MNMNKQEAIEKIEKLEGLTIKDKDFNLDIEMIPKGDVAEIKEDFEWAWQFAEEVKE